MKKIILLFIPLLAFLVAPSQNYAQKRTEHYPNGQKSFRGKYALTWADTEPEDWIGLPNEINNQDKTMSRLLDKSFLAYLNLFPERRYEGKCVFYYPNGKKWFTGKYKFGVKQGKFTYWYNSGQMAMERFYKNGMADGNWKTWDKNGKMTASYAYKTIPTDKLTAINNSVINSLFYDNYNEESNSDQLDSMKNFTSRNLDNAGITGIMNGAFRNRMPEFEDYIENNLFKKAIWDGPFTIWENGRLKMEFNYSNNQPTGIWKLYENDQLAFETKFENGKITDPKEYQHPEYNQKYVDLLQKHKEDSIKQAQYWENKKSEAEQSGRYNNNPNAVNPGLSSQPDPIFRYVEQNAEFVGNLTAFIKNNMKYPKEALANNIQGRVYAQFIILKSGEIDPNSIKIMKSLGYGTDKEVIRLIKFMPKWKPAKQNGKAVNMYYTLPFNFSLQ